MTITVESPTTTQAQQQAALLRDLAALLDRHPAATDFRLVTVSDDLPVADDEVLVQRRNPSRQTLELHPIKITHLQPSDVLHLPLDPTDSTWTNYASTPQEVQYVKGPDGYHYMVR
ncbi:hypothetical protein ACWEV4_32225 [Streptomyces sp. NPDC003860]